MEWGVYGIYFSLFVALYYQVVLLISFFEQRPDQKTARRPGKYPSVTIVVPAFNEERTIAGTLDSLLALEYPKTRLRIMVIDDGSRDSTGAVAERYAAEHPQIDFHSKQNGGKYTALNYAIERCTTDIIGCLDADSFVAPDALMEVVKKFESDRSIMAITPAMKVHRPKTLLELMQAVEYTFGIFYKKMFDNLSAISVLPGPFSFYRKEVFDKIGLFRHAHNTEDMEIAFRMHAHGLKIANAHTAHVYTTVPRTVRTLIKQRTRWSQGFLQNSKDYKYMYFNRRYGNFGLLVLPFSMAAFFCGLYMALYMLYTLLSSLIKRVADLWVTGVPPIQAPRSLQIDWLYTINTDMTMFVVFAVLGITVVAIVLGQRISDTRLTAKSFVSYFLLFGLVAPLWLFKAAWGALLARESAWR